MRIRPLLLLLGALALLAGTATLAGAHTQVRDAWPGPAETVGGTVDRVVVEFLDPVVPTPEVEVTGPGGDPVPGLGAAVLTADDVVERPFDPLTEPGTYQVDYTFTALDGAVQTGAHQFRFEPGGGGIGGRVVVALVVVAVVGALVGSALVARRRAG